MLLNLFINCNLKNKDSLTKDSQYNKEIEKDYKVGSDNKLDMQIDQSASPEPEAPAISKENELDKLKGELKAKFSDNFEFLREALSEDDKLEKLLQHVIYNDKKTEIDEILYKVKTELEKCIGENSDDQKKIYKTLLGAAYNKDNLDNTLEQLKNNANSTCNGEI